jgi:hypothetical protein
MANYENNFTHSDIRFRELATKLDKILIKFDNNINVICNSSVHLSRNHPEYLGPWKNLIHKKNLSVMDYLNGIIFLSRSFLYFSISILLEFLRFSSYQPLWNSRSSAIDFMFISHQIDNKVADDDFYFGGIIHNLSASNKNVIRLLISHTKSSQNQIESGKYLTKYLNKHVRKSVIINYFLLNLYSVLILLIFCLKNKFTFYEIISLLTGQLSNFSLIKIMANLEFELSLWRPKNLVITYEGNAIERAVFLLSKKYGARTFGYQHAPLIQSQYSILRLLNSDLDPDVILCSGPYSASKLMGKIGGDKSILTLGSPKFEKFVYKKKIFEKDESILLVPDGNRQSIDNFVNLGLLLVSSSYSGKVLIRSHPLFYKYLENKINNLKEYNSRGIFISQGDLNKVLKLSKWVVYENSSVAIQALFEGCNIIYMTNPLTNIDPLWEYPEYRSTAETFFEVKSIIESFDPSKSASLKKIHTVGSLIYSELNLNILNFESYS